MQLYFSPLACSLSARIALYEASARAADFEPVEYIEVDTRAERAADGSDYRAVYGLGLVPALRLASGEVLSENAAILQYIAERYPEARLGPVDLLGRTRLRQWLSFIGAELHKAVYTPLLDPRVPSETKRRALEQAERRFAWLEHRLEQGEFLLPEFSVADAYLATVLNWSRVTPLVLARWPRVARYLEQMRARPALLRALSEELELYQRKLARQADAHARLPATLGTEQLMACFNDAFQRHDPSLLAGIIADDCVLENTHPAPDGSRHVGGEACLELWSSIATASDLRFELERVDVAGERATIFWRLHKAGASPLRGINLMRVREGKIVEALGYVKGA